MVEPRSSDEFELALHSEALRRFRDVALAFLPVCYGLGYFAWAAGTLGYGLGHVDVPPSRYVELGILAALLATALLVGSVVAVISWRLNQASWKRRVAAGFSIPLIGAVFVMAFYWLLGLWGIFRLSWDGFVVAALTGLVDVPFIVFLCWFAMRTGTKIFGSPRGQAIRDNSRTIVITPLLATCILGAAISFPAAFIEHTNPEFGGLLPRVAVLEVEGDPPDSLRPLFSPNHTNSSPVSVSEPIWMLHEGRTGYLVRLKDHDQGTKNAPLFEVPYRIVQGVHWID